MVIKHFLHIRDNVGCQLLKRNVQIGAMVVGNTDNTNNEQWLEKREPITERAGNVTDLCQCETDMDIDRSMGFQYM